MSTHTLTILYVAASDAAASDGASALEREASATPAPLAVEPAVDFERIRERAPAVDCVVFAETPTTAAGAHLLEVIEACESTPLVLYTEESYGPTAARSTEGVAGYVRRDAVDGSIDHLVDEIRWVCEGRRAGDATPAETASGAGSDGDGGERDPNDRTAETKAVEGGRTAEVDLLETLHDGVFTVDRQGRIGRASEWIGRLLDVDPSAIAGVPLQALETGDTLDADDFEALEGAIDRVRAEKTAAERVRVTAGTAEGDVPLSIRASAVGDEVVATVSEIDDAPTDSIVADLESFVRDALEEPDRRFERAVDLVDRRCSFESCRVVHDDDATDEARDALTSGEPVTVEAGERDDEGRGERADDGADESASLAQLYVPVGSAAVFHATAEGSIADDDRHLLEVLAAVTAAALARDDLERSLETERERVVTEREGFEALFDGLPTPLLRCAVVEGSVVVRAANAAFERTFEGDRDAVAGASLTATLSPTAGSLDELQRALERGEGGRFERRLETPAGARDVAITVVPSGRTPAGGVVALEDVTGERHRAQQVRAIGDAVAAIETALEADDARGRTPLNVARGFLELASETGDEDHFEEVEAAHDEVATLHQRLRDLAGRATVTLEAEPVGLREVVRRAWAGVDAADGAGHLECGADAVLQADRTALERALEADFRRALEGGAARENEAVPTLRVAATEDGFVLAIDGGPTGAPNLEAVARAHGWSVQVAADGARVAVRGALLDAASDARPQAGFEFGPSARSSTSTDGGGPADDEWNAGGDP